MKNLILKDLKLSVHPTTAIYAAVAGGLMFVPAYPRSMAFLYSIIGVFMIFQCDLQNHDRTFCCLLPVTKKQIAEARVTCVVRCSDSARIDAYQHSVRSCCAHHPEKHFKYRRDECKCDNVCHCSYRLCRLQPDNDSERIQKKL